MNNMIPIKEYAALKGVNKEAIFWHIKNESSKQKKKRGIVYEYREGKVYINTKKSTYEPRKRNLSPCETKKELERKLEELNKICK